MKKGDRVRFDAVPTLCIDTPGSGTIRSVGAETSVVDTDTGIMLTVPNENIHAEGSGPDLTRSFTHKRPEPEGRPPRRRPAMEKFYPNQRVKIKTDAPFTLAGKEATVLEETKAENIYALDVDGYSGGRVVVPSDHLEPINNLPAEAGLYWARGASASWWDHIILLRGKPPFLTCEFVYDLRDHQSRTAGPLEAYVWSDRVQSPPDPE